jgi:hypothetical protein
MHAELSRLRAKRTRDAALQDTTNLAPTQGISYTDPGGSWTCVPTHPTWRQHAQSPDGPSVLELRVMAAHLSTALDHVTLALHSKGVFDR